MVEFGPRPFLICLQKRYRTEKFNLESLFQLHPERNSQALEQIQRHPRLRSLRIPGVRLLLLRRLGALAGSIAREWPGSRGKKGKTCRHRSHPGELAFSLHYIQGVQAGVKLAQSGLWGQQNVNMSSNIQTLCCCRQVELILEVLATFYDHFSSVISVSFLTRIGLLKGWVLFQLTLLGH